MSMKISTLVLATTSAALIGSAASAHHSGAMFDQAKTVALDGTIKEFQWTNPHSWVQILVKDASGKEVEWSIEGGSPNGLIRTGWKPTSLKPGDKAVIMVHPLKDGGPGGGLVSATVNGVPVGAPKG